MDRFLQRPTASWAISAIVAVAFLLGTLVLPLWRLELVAPQYPAGLVMRAYGYKFAEDPGSYYDDVKEINALNHYIGMKPIEEVTEMRLFVPGVLALALATCLSMFIRWHARLVRGLVVAGYWFMPAFFVTDLQYWLYHYGHTMDPEAALNTGSFTPKVFGTTKVWNFHSVTRFELGFYFMVFAAVAVTFGPLVIGWTSGRLTRRTAGRMREPGVAVEARVAAVALLATAGVAAMLGSGAPAARAQEGQPSLQARIDRAAPEEIIIVEPGVYDGPLVIDKPVSLIGQGWPVIDGGGDGDVITVTADDVVVAGLDVRGSGRSISREPAAIKISDADRVTISGNRIRDAHVGVHVTRSQASIIRDNEVDVGRGVAEERRGHAIYLWEVHGSTVHRNVITNAADGIHLEFAHDNLVAENTVTGSRYALHLMYAHRNRMVRNTLTGNLSGAVLMFSHGLIVKDNELSENRRGATGAGILLKDNDDIYVEGNRLLRNKYGITVEGAPQSAGATAIFRGNLLALNDVGIALTSNSPITFVENAVIDNFVQVRAASGAIPLPGHGVLAADAQGDVEAPAVPTGAVWSSEGRGNYWSDYRGYDRDGDGVGDVPYLPRPAFAGRLAADETLQLFRFTLAQLSIDRAADLFPVYRYDAVIADAHPLMSPPAGSGLDAASGVDLPLLAVSAGMLAAAVAVLVWTQVAGFPRAWQRAATRPPAAKAAP